MASSRKPGPLGVDSANVVVEGLLVRSAPVFAGLLGSLTFEESSGRHADPARWMADGPELRAGHSAGLIRLARAGEWDADARRLEFATADDARKAVLRLLEEPAVAARLHAMCGLTGGPLIAWTSQQLPAGTLKLLWRKRARIAYATAAATAPAPPPRSRPSRPPPSTPSPQYSTFPPDLDAAAVAAVLKDAARDGVPARNAVRLRRRVRVRPVRRRDGLGRHRRSLVFRFYDPRVLRVYLPTCTSQELATVFGPIGSFIVEHDGGDSLIEFGFEAGACASRK